MLAPETMLDRPRQSRILYRGKLYDYPLVPMNVLRNLGPIEAVRCVASYLWVRVHPPKNQDNLEGFYAVAIRVAAVSPLLQDLHGEGVGRAGHGALRRLGRAACEGPVDDHAPCGRR